MNKKNIKKIVAIVLSIVLVISGFCVNSFAAPPEQAGALPKHYGYGGNNKCTYVAYNNASDANIEFFNHLPTNLDYTVQSTLQREVAGNDYRYKEIEAFANQILEDTAKYPYPEKVFTIDDTENKNRPELRKAYAIARGVCDYLVYGSATSEYDEMVKNDKSALQNVYAVFKTRRAVCTGYAYLRNLMLDMVGIHAVEISYPGHTYTAAVCDGEWFTINYQTIERNGGDQGETNGKYIQQIRYNIKNDNTVFYGGVNSPHILDDYPDYSGNELIYPNGISISSINKMYVNNFSIVSKSTINTPYFPDTSEQIYMPGWIEDSLTYFTDFNTITGVKGSYAETLIKNIGKHNVVYNGNKFTATRILTQAELKAIEEEKYNKLVAQYKAQGYDAVVFGYKTSDESLPSYNPSAPPTDGRAVWGYKKSTKKWYLIKNGQGLRPAVYEIDGTWYWWDLPENENKDEEGNTVNSTGNNGASTSSKTNTTKKAVTKASTASQKVTKPKGTVINKLVKGKKKITVKWKKAAGINGYQIQLATDKKFKKNKKTVNVAKAKTTSKTVKKLKTKKKYYVRIRTYKTVKGKKIYSSWSKIKTVKTK